MSAEDLSLPHINFILTSGNAHTRSYSPFGITFNETLQQKILQAGLSDLVYEKDTYMETVPRFQGYTSADTYLPSK